MKKAELRGLIAGAKILFDEGRNQNGLRKIFGERIGMKLYWLCKNDDDHENGLVQRCTNDPELFCKANLEYLRKATKEGKSYNI